MLTSVKDQTELKLVWKNAKGKEEMILSTSEVLPLVLSAPTSSNSAKTHQPAIELFCFLNELRLEIILRFFLQGS